MPSRFFVLAWLVLLALFATSTIAQDEEFQPVLLGELPDIRLAPSPPLEDEQVDKIKKLIDSLVDLDRPDYGLSTTLEGSNFAPLPGHRHFSAGLLTKHGLKTSDAVKSLVELGPDALPFLVEALGDQRPTKLKFETDRFLITMHHRRELHLNALHPFESEIAERQFELFGERPTHSYTVKVGDVCFVIIGQIGGRPYSAVRYQPSLLTVFNCPAHDEKLRQAVWKIWEGDNGRDQLFQFLRHDYAMRAAPEEERPFVNLMWASRYLQPSGRLSRILNL